MHQHVQLRAPQVSATTTALPIYTGPEISLYTPTDTSSSATASFTGDPTYAVFPNGQWLSRFYVVSSQYSGLNNLDTDLYNRCYLPYNPLPYNNNKREESWVSIIIEKPDYQKEEAPCKRQAAINTNCYLKNTNGTFPGLTKYEGDFEEQQHCYCEKYPFFDSVLGCQKCFEMHGGIEGYHWFPENYTSAAADAYCNAAPLDQEFYDFVMSWKSTAVEANVPSTTAKDVLGTQTAPSLYYTANAAESGMKASSATRTIRTTLTWRQNKLFATFLVGFLLI